MTRRPVTPRPGRRLLAAGVALVIAGAVAMTAPIAVSGAPTGSGTGTGAAGQTLTVTPVDDLDPAGETVTVTGAGFDVAAGFDPATDGLYVAFCVDQGPAVAPSPCVGGVDMSGASGASRWVTNDPYPGTPAVAIGADGSFTTTITVQRADADVDCDALPAGQSCKVVARADHRAAGDRSHDVKVPVTFGEAEPAGAAITVEPATDLDPAGSDVTVTGTGFPTAGPGLYVVYGPPPEGNVDASMYGAQAFVPASAVGPDGSFSTTLAGVTAAYAGDDGNAYDFTDGGGFVSTMRAHGTPDPAGDWETSVPVAFAGAPLAETTTSLVVAPTTVTVGSPVVLTATVAATAPPAAVTSGTVEMFDGTTSLGSAPLGPDGRATRTATFATTGVHTVTARFTGTTSAAASTSAPVTVTVTAAPGPDPDPDPDPGPDLDPGAGGPRGTRTGTGAHGQTLTATPVDGLDPAGTEVEVEGRGFTEAAGFAVDSEGMYLSFCVDQGAGVQPSPCVGGVDTEGSSGASQWVTNNPYEGVPADAVTPVAAGGSFRTTITVAARDEFVDCLDLPAGQRCVITTRMDHRATADRSQDVKVPVCFAGEAACAVEPIDPTAVAAGGDGPFGGYPLPSVAPSTGVAPLPLAGPRALAATGFAARPLVPAGLALVVGGAGLVLVARRRVGPPTPATAPVARP